MPTSFSSGKRAACVWGMVLIWGLAAGCSSGPAKFVITPSTTERPPFTVAILPFVHDPRPVEEDSSRGRKGTASRELSATAEAVLDKDLAVLREGFASRFAALAYKDLSLARVDAALTGAGIANPLGVDVRRYRQILNADAVVLGRIHSARHSSLGGLGFQCVVDGAVEMFDTRSGETLWRAEHAEIARGGLLFEGHQILDALDNQKEAAMSQAFARVGDEFARKVIQTAPNLATIPPQELVAPVARRVTLAGGSRSYGPGDVIEAECEGAPGVDATFSLGTWRTGIPMTEVTSGVYRGAYVVLPGDTVAKALLLATLTNAYGVAGATEGADWVTVDAAMPESPTDLTAFTASGGGATLSWRSAPGSDVAGYEVYRSDGGASPGYRKIATANAVTYRDPGSTAGSSYVVVAVSKNGCRSYPTSPASPRK